VALLGLKPVFVEVDPKTYCLDPEALRKAISPKTKAIVPVHLYGHAAPMEEILAIAGEFGIPVIEDNAQAIGCNYSFSNGKTVKTGSMGTIGSTSFYPSKNLGAFGDAGALFTNDAELAHKMKMIANHGQQKRYYHEIIGCNSRLDSIQAAVLNIKLRHLDAYNAARNKVASYYNNAFKDIAQITTPFTAGYSSHVFHQYTILLENADRDALQAYLAEQKIPSMIYYPVPGHKQAMFDSFGVASNKMEVTDWLTERVISLPIHSEMDDEQLIYITEQVINFIKN
jgi:dTDP-4-amino-4,6-dideoxygalactose transaminase